jgi:CubicO group peptidase (beta-lactamase class C family)
MQKLVVWLCSMVAAAAFAQELPPWRTSTPEEQRLDAVAFEGFDSDIAKASGDVQSVVVVLRGRKVYEYYRDGNPDALRDTQSVTKSALALLVGTALRRGQLASLEQPVVDLMPDWRAVNPDPRSHAITLRHLLSMTTGFEVDDNTGTACRWLRLQLGPGRFAQNPVNGSPMTTAVRPWSKPFSNGSRAAASPTWRATNS